MAKSLLTRQKGEEEKAQGTEEGKGKEGEEEQEGKGPATLLVTALVAVS